MDYVFPLLQLSYQKKYKNNSRTSHSANSLPPLSNFNSFAFYLMFATSIVRLTIFKTFLFSPGNVRISIF